MDSTTKKTAAIYRAMRTGTIDRIYYGQRTGVYSGPSITYSFRVETVTAAASTSGFPAPSGTLFATNSYNNVTITSAGNNQYVSTSSFVGQSVSVNLGDYFAIVVQYSSGSPGASNYLKLGLEGQPVDTGVHGFPISLIDTGGGWGLNSNQAPILGFRYVGGSFVAETWAECPTRGLTTDEIALSTSATYREAGTAWNNFFDCVLNGFLFVAKFQDASTAFDVILYKVTSQDTTVDFEGSGATVVSVASQSFSSGTASSDWSSYQYMWLPFPETRLRAFERYLLAFKPTTTDTVTVVGFEHESSTSNARRRFYGAGFAMRKTSTTWYGNWLASTWSITPTFKQITNRRFWS
jgi:hypothetical protein